MNREITQPRARSGQFAAQLSAPRRGARLARLLATEQLRSWGLPLDDARQVIAELASNAGMHGYVPGRDFRSPDRDHRDPVGRDAVDHDPAAHDVKGF